MRVTAHLRENRCAHERLINTALQGCDRRHYMDRIALTVSGWFEETAEAVHEGGAEL